MCAGPPGRDPAGSDRMGVAAVSRRVRCRSWTLLPGAFYASGIFLGRCGPPWPGAHRGCCVGSRSPWIPPRRLSYWLRASAPATWPPPQGMRTDLELRRPAAHHPGPPASRAPTSSEGGPHGRPGTAAAAPTRTGHPGHRRPLVLHLADRRPARWPASTEPAPPARVVVPGPATPPRPRHHRVFPADTSPVKSSRPRPPPARRKPQYSYTRPAATACTDAVITPSRQICLGSGPPAPPAQLPGPGTPPAHQPA